MIGTQSVQDRGVDVVNVKPVFDGVKTEVVGIPDDDARPNTSAGHPHGESVRIMVATIPFSDIGVPPIHRPDHQRLVKRSPALEILEEASDGLIHSGASFV